MKWTDTFDLAIALSEAHPEVDPKRIRFTDLMNWVLELPGFDDDPKHCGEKILPGSHPVGVDRRGRVT